MDWINRRTFHIIAGISISILSYIRCAPIEDVNIDVTTPCKDVAEAINRLYGSLPERMPLEARCKRYSVFLSMADIAGVTNELALLQLSGLREEILDWLHGEIKIADSAARYMTALDAYRATRLEPAFIDLTECLSDIQTSDVKTYLDNPELKIVEKLYRQALASPADEINLGSVDFRAFHSGFRTNLEKLFEGHSDTRSQIANRNSGQIDLFNQLSPSYLPRKLLAEQFIHDTEERRRIFMERKRQPESRHRNSAHIREDDRDSKRQKIEQQQKQKRHEWPETIEDPRLNNLLRQWKLKQEGQRRYRERNRERLQANERERQRWRRQKIKEQKNLMMQSHANEVPASISRLSRDQQQHERQQGFLEVLVSSSDQSAFTSRPTILESSLSGERVDPVEVQATDQASEQQLWLERLYKLEKAKCRALERERRKRAQNPHIVRPRERERKRRWRLRLQEQKQKRGNPLLDVLNGSAESTLISRSGLENRQQ